MMHFDSLQGWLSWQESLHPLAIDLGLERAAHIYRALNPDAIKPPTITVAGTNGKGSCVAFLEAIYTAAGYRVGSYTSPHIQKYNERIKINGVPVSDALICEAFARIEAVRKDISLSYFEFGTLAALDIFWRSDVDIQLLEVGMGGRLDAVNIIDADVALVSSIHIDHVDWLGTTRETIGYEKAGIFRKNTPAIIGDLDPPDALRQSAIDKQALLYCMGKDFTYQKQQSSWDWSAGEQSLTQLPEPGLKGEHQYRNASSVIMAVQQLNSRVLVTETAIRSGLKNVSLPGRFQRIDLADNTPLLLDVGHNPEAVTTLTDHLNAAYPNRRVHAVFSMMKDKDIASVLKIMAPAIHAWYFVPLTNPRAISTVAVQEFFSQCQIANVSFDYTAFAGAFAAAKKQCRKNDLLLVFGSFFLVSDCLNELEGK
ncbi:bifunctional folylpolyglutamate synthase and dihydrofolate synthase [Crenothrix polyspora]|uniref:Dihydrofolate synthase/folylpolyglutamate synthase n=1 Tax=Crenothrix polyspora TaxID=360316 RepID=A0A1R4HIT3_9GAMM|nr:bifunctional tetrahydrofolate synthase/dihydrofolate synthase [Crenothrix polyspora]SJM95931.1 bifunctional folylpolyglutamate synthase and dihydrofolate synthase [Crenothrix polyspora]